MGDCYEKIYWLFYVFCVFGIQGVAYSNYVGDEGYALYSDGVQDVKVDQRKDGTELIKEDKI